jgi:adenylylsulfate kinase-like enzyme
VDDPYERPHNAEITIDTISHTAEENAERIITYLTEEGFMRSQK